MTAFIKIHIGKNDQNWYQLKNVDQNSYHNIYKYSVNMTSLARKYQQKS